VSELPTGAVTLLLADVEQSTSLWESQPDAMTAAVAQLDRTVCAAVAAHNGVRPVEQGEGDSFVVAFAQPTDAVACALALQRAPLTPIRLRIGVHTGEVRLRDTGNYIGPTINRAARLRDLAHGGQTVLSGTTHDLVVDTLPADTWLTDLGRHGLRGLARPERVVQLCHPDLRTDFPPLRTQKAAAVAHLPVQLTRFVGRTAQISQLRQLLGDHRLVTLSGPGGVGKTRLALEVAADMAGGFGGGVWFVDLSPLTDEHAVPITMARTMGVPDRPGRSRTDTVIDFIGDHDMLVVLDNCEHLLDACADLAVALLSGCPRLTVLATSRELMAVPGEVSVPSLSVADEAIELFTDRARQARPAFRITEDNKATVAEIGRRLDGLPLAIELAAARVRVLSPEEILVGLHDRFRLLTVGARTRMRRQQTLRASVEWSHALLTEPEQVLFRQLSVFMGGFDLDAAQALSDGAIDPHRVLDLLAQLVDKSLVVAETTGEQTRYRLLETMRQFALEMLRRSGEAGAVQARHRDHYAAVAARLDTPASNDFGRRIEQAEIEIDNFRAAFDWSRQTGEIEVALGLASSLQPLWLASARPQEGLAWFDAVVDDCDGPHGEVAPAVLALALADKAMLDALHTVHDRLGQAERALAIARELDDPALVVRALIACGSIACYTADVAVPYLGEAIDLARDVGDRWRLIQALAWRAFAAVTAGDPVAARTAAEEGHQLAEAIGDGFTARQCRRCVGLALAMQGNLAEAIHEFRELCAEADDADDPLFSNIGLLNLGQTLAYRGDTSAARAAAQAAIHSATEIVKDRFLEGFAYSALALTALAEGNVAAAAEASEVARTRLSLQRELAAVNANPMADVALCQGDLAAARRWSDDAVSTTAGWYLAVALTTRARVAIAYGEPGQAARDAHHALACATEVQAYSAVPDILECLAGLSTSAGSHRDAARLFGAAEAVRRGNGVVRFKVYDADYEGAVTDLRNAMDKNDFDDAWGEGAALSIQDAISYAQRRRGERRRPASGWASLTPAERAVVRLVGEGLANKDIAARLFVSPRTVQTHLTHAYTKLGVTSRVTLAYEAARRH
jgi:predicted ATPase/class 3 adenylate cyclase/DNA-binding CsgD family transcriptional regulator